MAVLKVVIDLEELIRILSMRKVYIGGYIKVREAKALSDTEVGVELEVE